MNTARGSAGRLRDDMLKLNTALSALQSLSASLSQISSTFNNATQEKRSFAGAMREANTMAGKTGAEYEKLKDRVSGA